MDPIPPLDRATMLARLDGDVELLEEVVKLFTAEAPVLVDALRAALASRDSRAIVRAAHTLKSCMSQVGADDAAAGALVIEKLGTRCRVDEAASHFAALEARVAAVLAVLPGFCGIEAA